MSAAVSNGANLVLPVKNEPCGFLCILHLTPLSTEIVPDEVIIKLTVTGNISFGMCYIG